MILLQLRAFLVSSEKKFAVVLLFPIDNASYTALSGDR